MATKPDNQSILPAVVLSTHNTGLAVIRALGKNGVPIIAVYYENRDMGYVSKYVKHKVAAPHPEQAQEEFIKLLIDLSTEHGRCVLFPCDDGTLAAVGNNLQALSEHHLVACPDWDVVRSAIDKPYTYQLAESLGIPLPKTAIPKDQQEAEAYSKNAYFPCLVKPRQSHIYFEKFRKKMVKAFDADMLMEAYHEAASAGIDVMLQEYIEGRDTAGINYNSYFWDGQPIVEFTAQKVRLSPPDSGVPSVVISKDIPEVVEAGRKLLKAFDYRGYSCMEFKRDPNDGIYKLMEINARHNRSSLLAVKCGINFPWVEYQHRLFGNTPHNNSFRKGVYWIDMTRDLATMGKYIKRGEFSLTGQLKPYLSPHVFATLSLKDPIPFIKRCFDILKMIAFAVVQRLKPQKRLANNPSLDA
jgi:predicted ATP-grasp superfamily ATP-dependent carboligase